MDLQFDKIKKIGFGDMAVAPKITPELRMRLKTLDLKTESGLDEAKEVMSSCFGDKAKKVREFMDENMTDVNLSMLQTYLIAGKQGLDLIREELLKSVERNDD